MRWNFLPCRRMPKRGAAVLVVRGKGRRAIVREAVYGGEGRWLGDGEGSVRAWARLPHAPITIALERVLDERANILDDFKYRETAKGKARLKEIDDKIEQAQRARESEIEKFARKVLEALRD